MIIIDSSNYIPEAFIYDFGKLPDVFLPIGNNRVIDIIIKRSHKNNEQIIVIIPNNFNLDKINNYQLSLTNIIFFKESQFQEISNFFSENSYEEFKNIKYFYRLALPIGDKNYFEKFKDFSKVIPSYAIEIQEKFKIDKLFTENKINNFEGINKYLYQLNLFNTKNTSKINTIDLKIPAHYFKARAELVGIRFFNKLKINNNKILKTVDIPEKGRNEANWYKNTKKYIPNISPVIIEESNDKKSYSLEYLPMVSLSEIYTYGQIDINYWEQIFISISNVLDNMNQAALDIISKNNIKIKQNYLEEYDQEIFLKKTVERLKYFCESKKISYPFDVSINNNKKVSIEKLIYFAFDHVKIIGKKFLYAHGDFCLSNILYDSRLNIIKLVDPRGHKEENNFNEMIKCQVYDLTKLAHSLLGYYDLINAGEIRSASYVINKKNISIICNFSVDFYHEMIFEKASKYEFIKDCKLKEYLPGTILLFLSMLPLHSDDEFKQLTLLGNAIRIYESLI